MFREFNPFRPKEESGDNQLQEREKALRQELSELKQRLKALDELKASLESRKAGSIATVDHWMQELNAGEGSTVGSLHINNPEKYRFSDLIPSETYERIKRYRLRHQGPDRFNDMTFAEQKQLLTQEYGVLLTPIESSRRQLIQRIDVISPELTKDKPIPSGSTASILDHATPLPDQETAGFTQQEVEIPRPLWPPSTEELEIAEHEWDSSLRENPHNPKDSS